MKELVITGIADRGSSVTRIYVGPSLHEMFNSQLGKFSRTFIVAASGLLDSRKEILEKYMSGSRGLQFKYIRDGEQAKSFHTYSGLLKDFSDAGITRGDLIAYIGGGTVGDLTGFAASTYMRGVKFMAVPTTLLAQVDSAIGGKNGINVSGIKNIAGTFYSPESIFCDTDFLAGMDPDLIRDSMSEVIKYAIIGDSELFGILARHNSIETMIENDAESIVAGSIAVKKRIVEQDPLERKGIREILNAGHTVAHAIEAASSNRISHGRAVLTGLLAEAFISDRITGTESGIIDMIMKVAGRYSMEYRLPDYIDLDSILAFAVKDKKVGGDFIRFPVMEKPGTVSTRNVLIGDMKELIAEWYMKAVKGQD